MKICNTTRMGFQAAIAIAIAEFVTNYFNLERGYWATLSAMALTAQTWGESVKRSFERVLMTILGGISGTILYFSIPPNSFLILGILLLFAFLTIYLMTINNLVGVFCLTGFVVFLFAFLGNWTIHLLRQRIEETALGAIIAVLVGFFFLPVKTNVKAIFIDYLKGLNSYMQNAFETNEEEDIKKINLFSEFQTLRKKVLSTRYEVFFHTLSMRDINALMQNFLFSTEYLANLTEAYSWLKNNLIEEDKKLIAIAREITTHNFEIMINFLKQGERGLMKSPKNLVNLLSQSIDVNPARFAALEDKNLGFYNLMYFFTRLNHSLNESYSIVQNI